MQVSWSAWGALSISKVRLAWEQQPPLYSLSKRSRDRNEQQLPRRRTSPPPASSLRSYASCRTLSRSLRFRWCLLKAQRTNQTSASNRSPKCPRPSCRRPPFRFPLCTQRCWSQTTIRLLVSQGFNLVRLSKTYLLRQTGQILTKFLTKKGVDFVEAEDGVVAIQLFKSFQPTLVWCDIQMPRKDGIVATLEMRSYEADNRRTPAYIVSSSRYEHPYLTCHSLSFKVALSGLSSELSNHSDAITSGQSMFTFIPTPSSASQMTPSCSKRGLARFRASCTRAQGLTLRLHWIIKGGPSLGVLTEGLLRHSEVLEARSRRAEAYEEQGRRIRAGLEVEF